MVGGDLHLKEVATTSVAAMPVWIVVGLILGVVALVLPPYLLWFNWWDRRMQRQALELFPEDTEDEQRHTWQLLRSLEGPRLPRIWKLDLSDLYARRKGKKPR